MNNRPKDKRYKYFSNKKWWRENSVCDFGILQFISECGNYRCDQYGIVRHKDFSRFK